ncbi:MAG: LysM peptidoglycan-binding domain-containing protein [Deltaproteobacteria bacterium]|jgi:LysM repeat protein|nr:LysM peptidoglycan-binding domain-containing protein [Deltaproteobacteria bacterium]
MISKSTTGWPAFQSVRGAVFVLFALSMALALALVPGCGGVSEEDINNLKLENQSLESELEQERHKSEVLNRALTNAYKERDRLVDVLNAQPEPVALVDPVAPAAGAAGQQTPGGSSQAVAGQTYLVQTGDTLSTIAQRHNTTTAVLLELNPYLMNRNNYMVWENDKILLPR